MIVAGVQTAPGLGEKEKNCSKAISLCRKAAQDGAELICFQEYFVTGYFTGQNDPKYFRLAEHENGETITTMRDLAQELGVTLVVPFFEEDTRDGGRYYNSAVVLSPEGTIVGKYRKQFIPSGKNQEKFFFIPGNLGTPVFQYKNIHFGIIICYDRQFIELSRILLLKGAHLALILSGASLPKKLNTWEPTLLFIAANHGLYVLGMRTASAIPQGIPDFGHSTLIDPYGNTINVLGDEEGYVLGEVQPETVRDARDQLSPIRDYRLEPLQELLALLHENSNRGE